MLSCPSYTCPSTLLLGNSSALNSNIGYGQHLGLQGLYVRPFNLRDHEPLKGESPCNVGIPQWPYTQERLRVGYVTSLFGSTEDGAKTGLLSLRFSLGPDAARAV